jgi:hypothetical protein
MQINGVIFPLSTNIKSFQPWGDNDISKRIKQSLILYDKIILETGTYTCDGKDALIQGYAPWGANNTKESVLEKIQRVDTVKEDMYITHRARILGDFFVDAHKYKVDKKDIFIADFRTLELISEIESGNYGKIDFLEYLDIYRYDNHFEHIKNNTNRDLADSKFAEIVRKTHGAFPAYVFLNNLNDSLAISHKTGLPVTVDSIYSALLKLKTKSLISKQFSVLKKLEKTIIFPDFGNLRLEEILELRKDKALVSFRSLISDLSMRLKSGDLNFEEFFAQELLKEIWEFVPNKKGVALSAFLGVLSNAPCSAVGSLTSIYEIGREFKHYRKFSSHWLSFVLKAKKLERK